MTTILHLTPVLEGGGAERQLCLLACELARRGVSVHIGCRKGGIYEQRLRVSDVSVHILGNHRSVSPFLFFKIANLVRKLHPDVIQTWLPQMDVVGGLVALSKSNPWILSERSSEMAYSGPGIVTWIRSILARCCSAIVTNSAGGEAYWRRQLGNAAHIVTIQNAVDACLIRDEGFAARPNPTGAKRRLIAVGRLHAEKSLHSIIDAARLVPRNFAFHISIIGDGPLLPELRARISDAGVGDRCSLSPFRTDWWDLLPRTCALISTSRWEGRSNVILEAVAGGCPLIVTDIPANREILDEESAIFVPPEDSAALASAIVSIMSNENLARARAVRAFDTLADGLRIQPMVTRYESVYRDVISVKAR